MISQPEYQDQSGYFQNYKEYLQNKIRELDKRTNQVLCQLADILFDNSRKIKDGILEEWKKAHFSDIMSQDIKESKRSIEISINSLQERLSSILNHARQVILQGPQPPTFQNHQFTQQDQSEQKITQNKNTSNTNKSQVKYNQQQTIDSPKILNTKCPICFKQMSNGLSYVKHMKLHDFEIESQGFDCPHCEVSFNNCQLLFHHLFKKHFDMETYKQTKRKSYYCPFTKQTFTNNQSSQLIHILRSSPHYTKAVDQILADQLQTEYLIQDGQKVKPKKPIQPQPMAEFIRGVTKVVFVREKLYGCPMCGLQEFKTIRNVGSHIRSAHGIKFRNKLFCPHCKIETRSAQELSTHLICLHGKIEQTNQGAPNQIYTTLNGLTYGDFAKLGQHLINDENYLTFFNPACQNEPFRIQQSDKDEQD